MHLVEILLPLRDRDGKPFPGDVYDSLAQRLVDTFGGVTSFVRAPAEGRWHDGHATERDDIVVMEVMIKTLDRTWWLALKAELESQFRQDEVVVRSHAIDLL
jgi:hypothetical protein